MITNDRPITVSSLIGSIAAVQKCFFCGSYTETALAVCDTCFRKQLILKAEKTVLSGFNTESCGKCGRPLVSSNSLCTECRNHPMLNFIDRIIPLYPYTSIWQELLTVWKIENMRGLSLIFAECFRRVLEGFCLDTAMVIPVPPRPGKIWQRGWDQMNDVALQLSNGGNIPVFRCLERTTSVQQKKLGREERAGNLRGHILLRKGFAIPQTAILIDDLMTTGSTLDSCAQALKSAGCREVYGITLFFD